MFEEFFPNYIRPFSFFPFSLFWQPFCLSLESRIKEFIQNLFEEKKFDGVIHLAAESHVDRSISNPTEKSSCLNSYNSMSVISSKIDEVSF